MSGKRLGFIAVLVLIFIGGVFGFDKFFSQKIGQSQNQNDQETIRGVVSTTLPSGKVVVVHKPDGTEIFLSLNDASTITDELGEDLFYSDIKVGMPISAAGIRSVKNNVVIPSLITVSLTFADQGNISGAQDTIGRNYFSLQYNPARWSPNGAQVLQLRDIGACTLDVSGNPPRVDQSWVKSTTERRIGGNIFADIRYTINGKHVLRVMTLEDAAEKYGARGELERASFDFVSQYKNPLAGGDLTNCIRAVDDVLVTFMLRNGSARILLLTPKIPLHVPVDEDFILRGTAASYDGTIQLAVVTDQGTKIISKNIPVSASAGERFGTFETQIHIPTSAPTRLQLRLFQYTPRTGSVTDLIQLPMTVE
ncbi:MAG: hypothetical protein HY220_03855 [Candidatus Sungbacteria bacterium]|uniref:Bacterial spore germination immunoglobulin-like domain-containing protein n=1 Tax=Candidatus Sungiibacteriota bacterium TaxID=2750080 RepID=A0A9D6LQM7_9BACT|nr:hypothetical protein [Candidatus Sungbacteria bacterium]